VLGEAIYWLNDAGTHTDDSDDHLMGTWEAIVVGPRHGCAYDGATLSIDCWGEEIDGSLDGWDQGGVGVSAQFVLKAGTDYTCAIDLSTDAASCWGASPGGVPEAWVGDVPTSGIIDVAPGTNHTCWMLIDGTVGCAGDDTYGQATPPVGFSFTAVDAGAFHTCALDNGGLVTCWGINDGSASDLGQVSDTPSNTFSSIDAAALHTCGVRSDGVHAGELTCWGEAQGTFEGYYGNSAGVYVSVWAGTNHSCGITSNGEANCWSAELGVHVDGPYGDTVSNPRDYFSEVVAIAPGYGVTCLLFAEGGHHCYEDSLRLHAEGVTSRVAYPPTATTIDSGFVEGEKVGCQVWLTDVYGKAELYESVLVPIDGASVAPTITDICVEWDTSVPYEDVLFKCYSDAAGNLVTYEWSVFDGVGATGTQVYGPSPGTSEFSPYIAGVDQNYAGSVTCDVEVCSGSCVSAADTVDWIFGSTQCDSFHSAPALDSLCVNTDTSSNQLTCTATATDIDGDSVTIDYQWTVVDALAGTNYYWTSSIDFSPDNTLSAACKAMPWDIYEDGVAISVSADLLADGDVCADLGLTAVVDFGGATCLEAGRSNVGCDYTLVGFDSLTQTDTSIVEYSVSSSMMLELPRFDQIEGGIDHVCAITSDFGAVFCWGEMNGSDASGQVPVDRADPLNGGFEAVADIGVGADHDVVITESGDGGFWGQPAPVYGLSSAPGTPAQIVAGDGFTCTLATDGTMQCFGNNTLETAVNMYPYTYTTIAAGWGYGGNRAVCGISTDLTASTTINCFDANSNPTNLEGQIPVGVDWVSVSVGSGNACAVDSSDSMTCWGNQVPSIAGAGVLHGVMTLAGNCRITTDKHLACTYMPTANADDPPAGRYSELVAGHAVGGYYCAISEDETIHCWGDDDVASTVSETVFMAPGIGELVDGDTLECTVTPCVDDGVMETCYSPVTASIPVQTTCN
jgi:hypothetical protein